MAGSAMAQEPSVEGWGQVVGVGTSSLGLNSSHASGGTMYRHVRSIHSETPSACGRLASPSESRLTEVSQPGSPPCIGYRPPLTALSEPASRPNATPTVVASLKEGARTAHPGSNGPNSTMVWLAVRATLLLFSRKAKPFIPYAFVYLGRLTVQSSDPKTCMVTLVVNENAPPAMEQGASGERVTTIDRPPEGPSSVHTVFLLPDGRWRLFECPFLKIRLPDIEEHGRWMEVLSRHCD